MVLRPVVDNERSVRAVLRVGLGDGRKEKNRLGQEREAFKRRDFCERPSTYAGDELGRRCVQAPPARSRPVRRTRQRMKCEIVP